MAETQTLLPANAVAALERRMHWRLLPAFAFMGIMGVLGGVALVSQLPQPAARPGAPDDADFRNAIALSAGLLPADGRLRLSGTLLGEGAIGTPLASAAIARAAEVELLVRRVAVRRPWDGRVWSALGSLALIQGRWLDAERTYRDALDRDPRLSEARLGLGVALAERARHSPTPLRPRALELAAIAQLTAVPADDPHHLPALYDRAVMLHRVGRTELAARAAQAYLVRDPSSRWAERLEAMGLLGDRSASFPTGSIASR